MKTIPINSSNLKAVGYDPSTRELRVEFHSGAVHEHVGVPPERHSALMAADSHGKEYNAAIRDHYARKQMNAPTAPMRDEGSPPLDTNEAYERAVRRFRGEK
jgi:hypothetical protein